MWALFSLHFMRYGVYFFCVKWENVQVRQLKMNGGSHELLRLG